MTDLITTAKKVAAALRGDAPLVAEHSFCDIGWAKCRCGTCRARHRQETQAKKASTPSR